MIGIIIAVSIILLKRTHYCKFEDNFRSGHNSVAHRRGYSRLKRDCDK
jgi:hypothetical protein